MQRLHSTMINTASVELWPSHLAKARSNDHARVISRADWLLRRKSDGCYLAAIKGELLAPLIDDLASEPGIAQAQRALIVIEHEPHATGSWCLPSIEAHLDALDVPQDYGPLHQLAPVSEPLYLRFAGRDRYRRPLWLQRQAARAWDRMLTAARREEIILDAISGYRSIDYQRGIFDRKLARDQSIQEILSVNAAPGYSEHHSGCAIDISSPGEPAAEESFEATDAFAWLSKHAAEFGFRMSYPRDNPHGVVYEPWHWCWSAWL